MNPKSNISRQHQIQNILNRYKKRLLRFDNVTDLGVGYKFVNNKVTDEMAIIVEVAEKLDPDEIATEQLIPKVIEGVAVDIVVSQRDEIFHKEEEEVHPEIREIAKQRDQFYDTLLGGIAIKNARLSDLGGTLGAVVYDQNSGNPYGITCRHVLTRDRFLSIRRTASVIQPTSGSTNTAEIGKAHLKNKLPLDCIRFKLNNKRKFDTQHTFVGLDGRVEGICSEISLGAKVMKSGARTGLTHGVIVRTSVYNNGFIICPDEDNKLIDGELSLSGDSGAIWITNPDVPGSPTPVKGFQAVGLHCLGNRRKNIDLECSMALRMASVAKYLRIRF